MTNSPDVTRVNLPDVNRIVIVQALKSASMANASIAVAAAPLAPAIRLNDASITTGHIPRVLRAHAPMALASNVFPAKWKNLASAIRSNNV